MRSFTILMIMIFMASGGLLAKKKKGKKHNTGFISIITSDKGGKVHINNAFKGTTPLKDPISVTPGDYKVKVEKKGFFPFEMDVTVGKGATEEVFVELIGAAGILVIKGTPGSNIELDGNPVGKIGPTKIIEAEIPIGKHKVKISIEGGGALFKTLSVSAGKTYTFEYFPTIEKNKVIVGKKKKKKGKKGWLAKYWWTIPLGVVVVGAGASAPFLLSSETEQSHDGIFTIK